MKRFDGTGGYMVTSKYGKFKPTKTRKMGKTGIALYQALRYGPMTMSDLKDIMIAAYGSTRKVSKDGYSNAVFAYHCGCQRMTPIKINGRRAFELTKDGYEYAEKTGTFKL